MEDNNTTTATKTTTEEIKTYTQEEVDALLAEKDSQRDREVTQGINTFKKNFLKEQEKKNNLKDLDENARALAELKDSKEALEAELAQMKVDKARSDLKSTLAARGLDARFADMLYITDDDIENQKTIAAFDKLWKASVQKEVENRIQGGSPKKGTSTPTEMTKDYFNKMSLAEQAAYLKNNPEFKQTMSTWYN